jgi:hypothetical protein
MDDTNLTLKDISELADSFATTLRGIYHPRIEYPALEAEKPVVDPTSPTIPVQLPAPVESPSSKVEPSGSES